MQAQILDDMDLERERGITIKAHAVTLKYPALDGKTYTLNLIDTPGHVDFTYEVSRSLAACEGAILVVDSTQGVEAQTLANTYLALENDLEVFPVLNKTDLPSSEPERVLEEINTVIGLVDTAHAVNVSAKTGENCLQVLEQIVQLRAGPQGRPQGAPAGAGVRLPLRPVPRAWCAWCASSTAPSRPGRPCTSWPPAASTGWTRWGSSTPR